jgi:glycosyltransferase involved in cell wall biosynthesis
LPYPPKGGAQIRSFNLIKELCRYHDVDFFCLVQEDVVINYFESLDVALKDAHNVFGKLCHKVSLVPTKSVGKYSKKASLLRSLFSLKSYSVARLDIGSVRLGLSSFIGNTDYDAVHLDTVSLSLLYDLFEGKSIVLNHHNIESIMMKRRAKEQKNIFLKLICHLDALKIKEMERRSSSFVSMHLVCSDLDGERFKTLFPFAKTITIANGIDCSTVVAKRHPDNKSLLFIGGLDWYPNADAVRFLLNEVWPEIIKIAPFLRLDIVGKNPPPDIFVSAIRYKNVSLHGFVNDIAPFYESSWLYICPIKDGGGTKLKVLDAMANGLPLLAHPIAMEGIDAEMNKHYFSAETVNEFVTAVLNCVNDNIRLELVGQCAKELIHQKYNFNQIGLKLASVY